MIKLKLGVLLAMLIASTTAFAGLCPCPGTGSFKKDVPHCQRHCLVTG